MRPSRRQRRRGAATVELAILLPLLAFLFVIGVDFARLYHPYVTITNAARSGALWGSDGPTRYENDDGIRAAALADASNLSPPPEVSINRFTDTDGVPHLEVTVTWQFKTVTSYPGVPQTMNLTRTVQMRVAPGAPRPSTGDPVPPI
jgi:Flp pilus assembly protein TadG